VMLRCCVLKFLLGEPSERSAIEPAAVHGKLQSEAGSCRWQLARYTLHAGW